MTTLLHLHRPIRVSILSDWISDEDVCCLDSALCCHELRNMYLDTLPYCSLSNEKYCSAYESCDKCDWIESRGVRLKRISLLNDYDADWFKKVLNKSPLKVFFDLRCKWTAYLVRVKAHHMKVENVSLITHSDVSVSELCATLNAVECARLTMDSFVEKELYQSISDLCPGVVHISTHYNPKAEDLSVVRENLVIEIPHHYDLMNFIDSKHSVDRQKCPCKLRSTSRAEESIHTHFALTHLRYEYIFPLFNDNQLQCLESVEVWGHINSRPVREEIDLLNSICRSCKHLTSIRVSSSSWEERNMQLLIETNGPHLRYLGLINGCKYPQMVVSSVTKCCSMIETLDLSGSLRLRNVDVMNALFQTCYRLTKIVLPNIFPMPVNHIQRWMRGKSLLKFDYVNKLNESIEEFRDKTRGNGLRICWLLNRDHYRGVFECGVSHVLNVVLIGRYDLLNEYMSDLVVNCPLLTELRVSDCEQITGQILQHLKNASCLTSLQVAEVPKITNDVLCEFLSRKPAMKVLHLFRCPDLTDSVVRLASTYCPHLEFLDVTNCEGVTTDDVMHLLSACKNLMKLMVNDTSVTEEVFTHPKCKETGFMMSAWHTDHKSIGDWSSTQYSVA